MTMATKTSETSTETPTWMQAREAVVVIVGASAGVARTIVVRNRHSGRLVEVPIPPPESPWLVEPVDGTTYVFRRAERVLSNHPAVLASPGSFIPYLPVPAGE
jgi:hypothetical protein